MTTKSRRHLIGFMVQGNNRGQAVVGTLVLYEGEMSYLYVMQMTTILKIFMHKMAGSYHR